MNYRIVEKGSFKLVGFKKRVPIVFKGVNPDCKMTELLTPEVIKQLKQYQMKNQLALLVLPLISQKVEWKRKEN